MIKRYSSPSARFTIFVKMNGKPEMLTFTGYDPDLKRRFLDVSDEDIQAQFERSPDFNVYFRLECVIGEDVVEKAPEPEVINEKEFKNVTEAKDWLIKEMKISPVKIPNKQAVINKARDLGYTLKFLTDNTK